MRRPRPLPPELPDVRDGLTRTERVVLQVLARAQAASEKRTVKTAELYGLVVERLDLSEAQLVAVLQKLGARRR